MRRERRVNGAARGKGNRLVALLAVIKIPGELIGAYPSRRRLRWDVALWAERQVDREWTVGRRAGWWTCGRVDVRAG